MTRIEALRQIVATKKAAKIDGHVVDTFTASRILASYKTLEGVERRRFASMTVDKMVTAGPGSSNTRGEKALEYLDIAVDSAVAGIVQADKDFLSSGIRADDVRRVMAKPIRMMFKSAINKKWPRPDFD